MMIVDSYIVPFLGATLVLPSATPTHNRSVRFIVHLAPKAGVEVQTLIPLGLASVVLVIVKTVFVSRPIQEKEAGPLSYTKCSNMFGPH